MMELSPFQKRLAKNGADLEFDENGEPRQMRIDAILSRLKSDSFENVQALTSEALENVYGEDDRELECQIYRSRVVCLEDVPEFVQAEVSGDA